MFLPTYGVRVCGYPLIVVHNFLLFFVISIPCCHFLHEKRIENVIVNVAAVH